MDFDAALRRIAVYFPREARRFKRRSRSNPDSVARTVAEVVIYLAATMIRERMAQNEAGYP